MPSSARRSTRSLRPPGLPTFANTVEALEQSGVLLTKVRGVFSNLSTAETNERLQAIQPRGRAQALGARRRHPAERGALRAAQGRVGRAGGAGALARAAEAARGHVPRLRPQRGQPRRGGQGEAPRRQRGAVEPGGHLRPAPAARDQRLPAGDRAEGRTSPACRLCRRGRRRGSRGGETARQVGVHASRAEHLAVPRVRRQPRSAPPDPPGLRDPGRSRRRVGQQGDARADSRPALRAVASPRVQDATPTSRSRRRWRRRRPASTTC